MNRICIVEREYIEEALQSMELIYPDVRWMQGQKLSEWTPSVKYFLIIYDVSGSGRIYYIGGGTINDCINYINNYIDNRGYIFEQLCYIPLEFDPIDDIYIGEDILI